MIPFEIWWKLLIAYLASSRSRLRASTLESTRSQHINDICRRFALILETPSEARARLAVESSVLGTGSASSVGAAAPQLSQNLLAGEISAPHSEHFNAS